MSPDRPVAVLPDGRRLRRRRLLLAAVALLPALLPGAETARRRYDLAAGDAAWTLRRLSAISGREILFAAEVVRDVRTNPVRGEFTPREAADRLLAGTSLRVTEDGRTGALAVHRAPARGK